MSRSTIPTYVVRYYDSLGYQCVVWNTRNNGKPTKKNLEAWRKAMNASFKTGGCNEHVSRSHGVIVHIHRATIHNQKTNLDVCETVMPTFEEI